MFSRNWLYRIRVSYILPCLACLITIVYLLSYLFKDRRRKLQQLTCLQSWCLGNERMNSVSHDLQLFTILSAYAFYSTVYTKYYNYIIAILWINVMVINNGGYTHMVKKIFWTIFSGTRLFSDGCLRPSAGPAGKMAGLEDSLTAMDWLSRLKVGVTGDQCERSWSTAARRMVDTNSLCGKGTVTTTQEAAGGSEKPGYSYSSLIYLAITSSSGRKMTLSEIYAWICDKFPYYKTADSGWKVSAYLSKCRCLHRRITYDV